MRKVFDNLNIANSETTYIFFMDKVFPDIDSFVYLKGQVRLRKYAQFFQKFYTAFTDFQESDIKRIMKAVVNKMLSEIDIQSQVDDHEPDLPLNEDEKSIINYLAGAVLKWGISKLKGNQRSWCQSLISSDDSSADHYRFRTASNTNLIVPDKAVRNLFLECEKELRKQRCLRSVNCVFIVNSLKCTQSFFFGLDTQSTDAATTLLQR